MQNLTEEREQKKKGKKQFPDKKGWNNSIIPQNIVIENIEVLPTPSFPEKQKVLEREGPPRGSNDRLRWAQNKALSYMQALPKAAMSEKHSSPSKKDFSQKALAQSGINPFRTYLEGNTIIPTNVPGNKDQASFLLNQNISYMNQPEWKDTC